MYIKQFGLVKISNFSSKLSNAYWCDIKNREIRNCKSIFWIFCLISNEFNSSM